MEQVAVLAQVSKQTVYKHFVDKSQLFSTVLTETISSTETLTHDMVDNLSSSDDLATDLRRFARQHIVDVTQPHILRLRRLIIAEAERFPDLARLWYKSGPERAQATLAEQFDALAQHGLLRMSDPLMAAQLFNWLILSIPLNHAAFHPDKLDFSSDDLQRYADAGVRVFLAAYGTASPMS